MYDKYFYKETNCALALIFCLIVSLAVAPAALADGGGAVGRIAFQLIGRNQVVSLTTPDSGTAVTAGYLTAIDGINSSLFSNPASVSEATAHFTFCSENYGFSTIVNGNSQVRLRTPGVLLRVYYQSTPGGNFTNLASLCAGQLIATLRLGLSQATRVDNAATSLDGATLVSASPFTFDGKRINLHSLLRNGVTLFLTGPAVPIGTTGVAAAQFAVAGSAIRNGGGDDR